jgi:hypothetical protein
MSDSKIYIFHPKLERLYLGMLFLFFPVLVFFVWNFGFDYVIKTKWAEFIVSYIFLNTAHIIVTFLMIGFLPEFKKWFSSFLVPSVTTFKHLLAVLVILITNFIVAKAISVNDLYLSAGLLFLIILTLIHNFSQTKGILLLYNKSLWPHLNDGEKLIQKKIENRERFLFSAALFFLISRIVLKEFLKIKSSFLLFGLNAMFCVAVAGILLNSLAFPAKNKSNKHRYQLTLVYDALSLFSPFALLIRRSLHGIEYAVYSQGIFQRSNRKWPRAAVIILFMSFSLLVLCTFLFSKKYFVGDSINLPVEVKTWIWFVLNSLEILHYYFDRYIFKFSEKSVQEHLSPVLLPGTDMPLKKSQ